MYGYHQEKILVGHQWDFKGFKGLKLLFRTREILMTASANIKTPSMDLPLKPGPKARKRAKQLQKKFTKVTLAQVMVVLIGRCMSPSAFWYSLA